VWTQTAVSISREHGNTTLSLKSTTSTEALLLTFKVAKDSFVMRKPPGISKEFPRKTESASEAITQN